MKSKKGAAIIAWVLLMGFAIGLATTIFMWMTQQTEEMSESAVKFVEGGMQCDEVMINVVNTSAEDCNPKATCCLKITNTRYLNIEKVILRGLEAVQTYDKCTNLTVKDSIFCGPNPEGEYWSAPQNVTVMPVVEIDGDLAACKNKVINIEC